MKMDSKIFASIEDLNNASFEPVANEKRAGAYLRYVSAAIRQVCDWELVDEEVLQLVCIQATLRILQADKDTPIGTTQESWSAEPLTATASYANPLGDIYFTKIEKEMLGIGAGTAMFINPTIKGTQDEQST